MARKRTTWAALKKNADPYLMNQDHVSQQPSADAYVNGDPSSWKEDVNPENRWEDEYKGDTVERNEIGMGEMRSETFTHPEKTANLDPQYLERKASICEKIARRMLGKTASATAIEDQAVALMDMGDADLLGTFDRLASQEEGQAQGQAQGEQKQAQQDQQGQGQGEQKQAQQDQQGQGEQKQAQGQQQQMAQGQQQQVAQEQQVQQAMQQAMQAMAQGDQVAADQAMQQAVDAQSKCAGFTQITAGVAVARRFASLMLKANQQQMGQQAQGQQQQMAQGQQQQQVAQGQQEQQVAQGQQQQVSQDQQMLDAMLMEGDPAQAEFDIELDAPEMGMDFPDEDPMMVFAEDQGQQEQAAQQQKEATRKTASAKPVSKIGGVPSSAPATSDVRALSSLWKTAPDVSQVFFGG